MAKNRETDESELYCHSIDKEKKEDSIKNKFQQRFEDELLKAHNALNLRNGTKRYEKVVERIGRLIVIHIRKSSKAEPPHQAIYDALNLSYQPGRRVKTIM